MKVQGILQASVGSGGKNQPKDVRLVQMLLNNWLRHMESTALSVDGIVGPKTVRAIADYQRSIGGIVDSRLDPGGPTLQALLALQMNLLVAGVNQQAIAGAKLGLSGKPAVGVDLDRALSGFLLRIKR